MNLATSAGSLAITGLSNLFSGATLYLYSGSLPSAPEDAATGNQLASFTFSTPSFLGSTLSKTGGYDSLTAAFVGNGTYIQAGTAGYARAVLTSTAWSPNTAYTRGSIVTNGLYLYVMLAQTGTSASSGGPTGPNNYGIVDNSCVWDYVGLTSSTVIADLTVGLSGTDVVLNTLTVASGTTITVTSMILVVQTV